MDHGAQYLGWWGGVSVDGTEITPILADQGLPKNIDEQFLVVEQGCDREIER